MGLLPSVGELSMLSGTFATLAIKKHPDSLIWFGIAWFGIAVGVLEIIVSYIV